MPFDSLPQVETTPDLSRPSLPGLAWLLRRPDRWPGGFNWNFSSFHGCAVELAKQFWPGHEIKKGWIFTSRIMGLSKDDSYAVFVEGARESLSRPIPPTEIARRIDACLASK